MFEQLTLEQLDLLDRILYIYRTGEILNDETYTMVSELRGEVFKEQERRYHEGKKQARYQLIEELWEELGKQQLTDDDDCLVRDWRDATDPYHWPAGSALEDIHLWFDENSEYGLHALMYHTEQEEGN